MEISLNPSAMQTQKKVPYCFYRITFPRKRSKNSLLITQEKFLIAANCFTRSIVRVISSYDMFVQICLQLKKVRSCQQKSGLYVLFPQFRPRDVLQGICLLSFHFKIMHTHAHGCTGLRLHLKETVLWGTITWAEMRKQNIQAKKVYSVVVTSQQRNSVRTRNCNNKRKS